MIGSLLPAPTKAPAKPFSTRPHVQDVPRHGFHGSHAARQLRPLFAGPEIPNWCPKASRAAWPPRAPLSEMVYQLVGGLRSGMGYCGARDIGELQRTSRFLRVSVAGLRESHVHDVIITKEAPNYRVE